MCTSTYGQPLNFVRFIIRRIKRIMPLYWLATTLALIVFLYNPKLVNSSGGETSIWASYTLFPNGKRFLNDNGWTLSYEFFFYFIFGLFIHKGTYRAIQVSSLLLLLLPILGLFFNFNDQAFIFSTKSFLIEFAYGMGCFYLFNMKSVRLKVKYAIGICIFGVILFPLQLFLGIPDTEKWRGLVWGIKMLLIFAGLLSLEDPIRRSTFLFKGLLLAIGDSSYSLYLIHPFVLSGTAICLRHFGMASNPWLFTIILILFSVAAGYFVYLYVERPLTSLLRRNALAKNKTMESFPNGPT